MDEQVQIVNHRFITDVKYNFTFQFHWYVHSNKKILLLAQVYNLAFIRDKYTNILSTKAIHFKFKQEIFALFLSQIKGMT